MAGLDEFGEFFGETNAEWETITEDALFPFIYRARFVFTAGSGYVLQIAVSDFHQFTFSRAFTVQLLDDLRIDFGLGGSWSGFVDYLRSSLQSKNVKIILTGLRDAGIVNANFTAVRSKGLPCISLSLNRIIGPAADDEMSSLSLALFKAFDCMHNKFIEEQKQTVQLATLLSSERERSAELHYQLGANSVSSRYKEQILRIPSIETRLERTYIPEALSSSQVLIFEAGSPPVQQHLL